MRFFYAFCTLVLISGTAAAEPDIQMTGSFTQVIPNIKQNIKQNTTHTLSIKQQPPKTISLMQLKLSEHAWHVLTERTEAIQQNSEHLPTNTQTQLGMNHVPVLDQGPYGTCATLPSLQPWMPH